ncbi:Zn(II)2Cys6 transcription factor [Aspergillus bertholletiae]|uniref:Zn(II)2Cys6 transcription factor n=1 Tax=Aspergillus bertholletiae TaxID=1226010 RepID=A0A5N7B7H9_9EURO|nr:Zn(II)2Cys6 transcription factor [Aspergillus bertholletiae]
MDGTAMVSNFNKTSHARQAACLNCRKSKVRCKRTLVDASCERCRQAAVECVVPSHHVGRQKGVKNKRKGLDKALHQIEQAIKRPKSDAPDSDAAQKIISNLQDLLNRTQGIQPYSETDELSEDTDRPHIPHSPHGVDTGDSLSLDDAENPLQLLARASDLQLSPAEVRSAHRWHHPESSQPAALAQNKNLEDDSSAAKLFFVPVKANLDLGPDMDPIELGLVTPDEAESLFAFFYHELAHTRWGLDPLVHTTSFVRSQSAFLFTSIMAASALFLPSAAALSKRLSRHCKLLAQMVITKRFRSVEIVLAFMVNVPWMAHGNYLGDDDTCSYIAMALAVALDLSLNKIVLPSTSFDNGVIRRLVKADCIDAKKALHMDGFDNVDPNSEWGQRLLRRRERTWIALFVLERGVCLARGRSYTVPQTSLIVSCDRWHVSNVADARDGPMNSMAALRRNLDDLFKKVKSSCDNYQITDANAGSEAAQSIKTMIESFYDRWYETWGPAIGEGQSYSLPPYVEILVTHTRLSTYGGVINHPTAPLEVKRFFRAAGLSSALNVMRAAIQGESRLKSMPNNTVIMISFAACSALSLSVVSTDTRSSLAPSVRNLIEETAGVLERIGATPSHRNGASVLYGRYLRELVRRGSENQNEQRIPAEASLRSPPTFGGYSTVPPVSQPTFSPLFWSEPLQFSAMSDGQIIDAVNRAGITFGTGVPDVPLDDLMSWDWLDIGNATDFGF